MSRAFTLTDAFTPAEIRAFNTKSDLWGWWAVASTWAVIAGTFALMALWPHVVTVIVGLVLLGGRQLALSILMHEAAHYSLFRTRALNDIVGTWLCAAPVWGDVARYRKHHIQHHAHTNSELDPDLSLVTPFPTSRRSLRRKILRDLTGATGLKRMIGLFLMDIGALTYTVSGGARLVPRAERRLSRQIAQGLNRMGPMLATNAVIAAALGLLGAGWTYLVWVAAYLTTYSLFLRIRAIAEHACTERSDHPLRNTRTTRAGLLARATVAPLHVNYHLEHHLMPAAAYYRLPAMHRRLREKALTGPAPGYLDVLRLVTARAA
ncbi:fatty acid desaturase family protein [Zavarzinia compransoris]|uniref:Fatty acid desaturase n=1 Tax=Zavarzinia compransoris TaxID=1264899 RepID=A0A317E0J2_9PROT|nr:fatty acid desaturase family protein [Zavarzinia compransoris]PWR19620.1 fatty acid desaturase [Zavarzinia compransoris]TDP40394.1 fatty acid desaturase [Zavarzinia compransoris]